MSTSYSFPENLGYTRKDGPFMVDVRKEKFGGRWDERYGRFLAERGLSRSDWFVGSREEAIRLLSGELAKEFASEWRND